jgi:isopentenyl-diphosphate delta-isomerase
MSNPPNNSSDPNASKRKSDHIELAVKSRTSSMDRDLRFHYEPFLAAHPNGQEKMPLTFLGKHMDFPIWISSMTGGTKKAKKINSNLARVAGKYKLGMGLGSCRALLDSDEYLEDFAVRKYIGDQPLYANLGIAQIEELIETNSMDKIQEMLKKLEADGLIIHINPFQEFIQPEGDHIRSRPIDTLRQVLDKLKMRVVVKEVGQGFGPASLRAMMQMPLDAIEFGAFGGTNFSTLELSRTSEMPRAQYRSLSYIGHSAEETVETVNYLKEELGERVLCNDYIVSGGISNFLDGYYGIKKLEFNAVYGMASGFLQFALKPYEQLEEQVGKHIEGLKVANAFLRVK